MTGGDRAGRGTAGGDTWAVAPAYEAYVGRWSREVAREFVARLGVGAGRRWLDAGCGTGALTAAVRAGARPSVVVGADTSLPFLAEARAANPAVCAGDARALPLRDASFDAVVSGLALNFVPDPGRALLEFARVAAPGAVVAAYVWDYAGGMEMIARFWRAAAVVDPDGARTDEARRFPLCRPDALRALWTATGLTGVSVRPIDVPTVFAGFDDFWRPFLGGQGAAPAYLARQPAARVAAVRERLRDDLAGGPGGTIALTARAWVVRGDAAPA